jgi:hypothetical protein
MESGGCPSVDSGTDTGVASLSMGGAGVKFAGGVGGGPAVSGVHTGV